MLNNVFIIIILCITFLCLFQFIATFVEYSKVPIVEPMNPGETIVFPEANKVDASNLKMRIDKLDYVIGELNAIRDTVSSSKKILKLTSSIKDVDTPDVKRSTDDSRMTSYTDIDTSELFDITISGEPLAQTIHVDIPVGKRGPDGNVGKRGPKGKQGEPGDVGPVGYCGLSIC